MKIAHVTRNVQRGKLPLTIGKLIKTRGKPRYNQAGVGHSLPGADHVALRRDLVRFGRKRGDRIAFRRAQIGAQGQPAKVLLKRRAAIGLGEGAGHRRRS